MHKRKILKMLNKLLFVLFIMSISLHASWQEYKTLFIAKDGRVIDRVNADITHTESIGYAMYLALQANDLKSFKKIHLWYKNNLAKNKFGLLSWEWGKRKDGSWGILDMNNASDGDLWIAYDNILMYERTKNNVYKEDAISLMKSIKKYLIVKQNGSLYLLPGKEGFEHKDSIIINLSYYLFFIFDKFRTYDKDAIWQQLQNDGISLLYKARFTPLQLNPDWISINKRNAKISLARNFSFGYDAIRIPYNILKSKIENKNKLLQPYKNYVDTMKRSGAIFGVTNLKKGTISIYNYSFAYLSIYNMIDKYCNAQTSFTKQLDKLKGKHKDDYYSYSIYLLTSFY